MLKILFKARFHFRFYSSDVKAASSLVSSRIHQYLREDKNFEKISPESNEKPIFLHPRAVVLLDRKYKKDLKEVAEDPMRIFMLLDNLYDKKRMVVTKLKAHHEALLLISQSLEKEFNKSNFVKLCYYASSYKKSPPGPELINRLINEYLPKALESDLSSMDFSILCLAFYKTSVRIRNIAFHERLINEVLQVNDDDPFLLIAFIKSIRHNQIRSDKILNKLTQLNYSQHTYHTLIHIFPYFADNRIRNDKVSEAIFNRCFETFDKETRIKDVEKLIHSCALLNMKIDAKQLRIIEMLAVERTNNVEFQDFFDSFMNLALSLWILNYKCIDLVKILLRDSRLYRTPRHFSKLATRKQLLRTCIEIEVPKLIRKPDLSSFLENRQAPGYLIKPSLEKMMSVMVKDHSNVTFVQQIKNLNIAGFLVTNDDDGSKIHYEVLDELTSLSDQTPDGIFALKLRLLTKKLCKVELIKV